ncbi:hypothetical protein [Rubrivivax sp. JA1026]|uniref:hypothetical protein n=1 Tax=Rubrivivax sp. JA1026 TaxID=2710888 RepID=UPI0013E91E52|nr:hypothetical protein [Rubrivivax sp. JA1026]
MLRNLRSDPSQLKERLGPLMTQVADNIAKEAARLGATLAQAQNDMQAHGRRMLSELEQTQRAGGETMAAATEKLRTHLVASGVDVPELDEVSEEVRHA